MIVTLLLALLTRLLHKLTLCTMIPCFILLIRLLTIEKGLPYLYSLQCSTYATYNKLQSLTILTIQMRTQ